MRRNAIITGILIGAAMAGPAAGQEPVPVLGPGDTPQHGLTIEDIGRLDAEVTRDPAPEPTFPDREVAGLPEEVPAESLNWKRVYVLTLVRDRAGGNPPLVGSLDPAALAGQERRFEIGDFARFRREFLAGRGDNGGAFHDPAEAYLSVLRRVQEVASARQQLIELMGVTQLTQELAQGQSFGLSQLDVDLVNSETIEARVRWQRRIAAYRDALDELKPALGLSPHAAVIPDRGSLAAFNQVFQRARDWNHRPDRKLAELPRIVGQLPALGEVFVNGRRLPAHVDQDVARLNGVLKDATDQAMRNHSASGRADPDGAVAIELRVRRRVRRLVALRGEYEHARRMYELGVRLGDQASERLLRPTGGATIPSRGPSVQAMVDGLDRIREAQDRLVALWIDFRIERLAFYRDLGTLPYGNWDVYLGSFAATAPTGPAPAASPTRGVLEPGETAPPTAPAPAATPPIER
ncbi:MAG: hypothetical protein ACYC61_04490 [Isosphaeraceae bacterium]